MCALQRSNISATIIEDRTQNLELINLTLIASSPALRKLEMPYKNTYLQVNAINRILEI